MLCENRSTAIQSVDALQDGCINVLQSPIGARGVNPRQQEVARCLEAVSAASEVAGRLWSYQRRKRNDGRPYTRPVASVPGPLCNATPGSTATADPCEEMLEADWLLNTAQGVFAAVL